jgi:hypothetical protein
VLWSFMESSTRHFICMATYVVWRLMYVPFLLMLLQPFCYRPLKRRSFWADCRLIACCRDTASYCYPPHPCLTNRY